MSVEPFITEHLDLWTEAVTTKSTSGRYNNGKIELTGIKKLRELILELAIRGKLLPQRSNDGSADEILERVAERKKLWFKEAPGKKPRKTPPVTDEEKRFDVANNWGWARLADLLRVINGRAYKKHEMLNKGTPLLRVGNLFTSSDWYYSNLELDQDKYIENGDLIYAWSASFGPFIWHGGHAIYHYHIWKLDLFDKPSIDKNYLFIFLQAITEDIKSSGSGIAMIHMTKAKMEELAVPIPPLAEQHRIVQKVDELMALCDRLEQQTRDQHAAHETLVDALLDTLTQSKDADELADNWARLAAHFDTLFTTEHSVDRLQDTIKQLAVMGKLVPQKNSDGDAAKLIESIRLDKEHLVNSGQINIRKELPKPSADEMPFETPSNWVWCRLEELTYHSESGWSPACKSTPRTGDNWGVLKVSAVSWGVFQPQENKELPPNLASKPKLEVKAGDFLISRANTVDLVARSVITPEKTPSKLMMSDKIVRFSFSPEITPEYVNLFNNSPAARVYYAQIAGGTSSSMKNVSRHQIQMLCLPLPPTGEQSRIVRRVNQLVAICDQLKARLNQAGDTRRQMANAVVEQAVH